MTNYKAVPLYMTPANSQIVSNNRQWIDRIMENKNEEIIIPVSYRDACNGNVIPASERLMALQHFPELFERVMFGITLRFMNANGRGWYQPEAACTVAHNVRWFSRFAAIFKPGPYFIDGRHARFYSFVGDMLNDTKDVIFRPAKQGGYDVTLKGKKLEKLAGRVFSASQAIQLFFYGSGQSPRKFIESMIKEFNSPFTYEEVNEKLPGDLKENSWLSSVVADTAHLSLNVLLKQKLLFSIIPVPHMPFTCHSKVPTGMESYKLPGTIIDSCEGVFGTTFSQQLSIYDFPVSYHVFDLKRQTIFSFPFDKVKELMIFTPDLPFAFTAGNNPVDIPPDTYYGLESDNTSSTLITIPEGRYRFICIDLTGHGFTQKMMSEIEGLLFMKRLQEIIKDIQLKYVNPAGFGGLSKQQ